MNKALYSTLPLLLILASCGNDPAPKKASDSAVSDTNTVGNKAPTIYLEGIYATSSAAGKGVENLFDSNPATIWQTQAGTGPDEGIMLYFQNALPIATIEIVAGAGSFAASPGDSVKPILVYTNGQVAALGKPNEQIQVSQNGLVKSLFIRLGNTGKEAVKTLREGVDREFYPDDALISISELKMVNDKGITLLLVPPRGIKGTVTASSTLAPEAAYSAANLFDSRKEFVWVEGAASSGEEEILNFEFNESIEITAIQIWNGYQRSEDHFSANARVRDFDFGVKGSPLTTYTLRDTKAGQKIELRTPAKGKLFTLKIKSIYPGLKYKDLAISDIVFFQGNEPFVLRSSLPVKYQNQLRAKVGNSQIKALLDRRISNRITEDIPDGDVFTTNKSLLLRSDGTFVYYNENFSGGTLDVSTIADGNWEILSDTQVKVFGKWTDQINWPEYYKGTAQETPTRIFKDVLTIDANQVVGTKMLGTFFLK